MKQYNLLRKLNESLLLEYDRKDLRKWAGEDLTNRFLAIRQRLQQPENDLGYWIKKDDLKQFEEKIKGIEDGTILSKSKKKKEEVIEGSELVLDEKGWKVYHVTSYKQAQKLGSGTTWCITGRYHGAEEKGEKYFNNYIRNYHLDGYYFIFDTLNRDEVTGDYLKYCAGYSTINGRLQWVYNGRQDNEISISGIPCDDLDRQIKLIPGKEQQPKFHSIYHIKGDVLELVDFLGKSGTIEVKSKNIKVIQPLQFSLYGHRASSIFSGEAFDFQVDLSGSNIENIKFQQFNNKYITNVILPDTLVKLGSGVFMDSSIEEIVIPPGVTKIKHSIFAYCKKLKMVTFNGDIEEIADDQFEGCSRVTVCTPEFNEVVQQFMAETKLGDYVSSTTGEIFDTSRYDNRSTGDLAELSINQDDVNIDLKELD